MTTKKLDVKGLDAIRKAKSDLIKVRRIIREEGEKLAKKTGYRKQVLVCGGTGCTSSKSMLVIEQLEKSLKDSSSCAMTFIEWEEVQPVPPHTSTCLR